MTKTILFAVITSVILLTGTVVTPLGIYQTADAVKSKGNESTTINSKKVCGDRLCSDPKAPIVKKSEKKVQAEQKVKEQTKAAAVTPKDNKATVMKESKELSKPTLSLTKTVTGTIKSSKDPGLGHENHQLAIILPPSDKVYRGHLTYSASEPVQLVALHGPLKTGKDRGQPTWSTDGTTKYGMTFVDDQKSTGVWQFAGNALAVHTMKKEPFTLTYSVTYTENVIDNVKTFRGTITSEKDPGLGHEKHQLAMILPPRDKPYRGTMTYDASEPIQLISLIGPIKEGEIHPPTTWSPDGKTIYGMIFVDPKKSAGSWTFSGNALAVHTTKMTPFTVSYSVVLTE